MKFPDKFIFCLLITEKRRENKHYYSYNMSKATDNNSNDFLAWKVQPAWHILKGVSDLEMCMDYFALPGKRCENLNFPAHWS